MRPEGDSGRGDERFGVRHGFEQKGTPQDALMAHRLKNDLWNVFYTHWPYDEGVRASIWADWAEMTLDDFDQHERIDRYAHNHDHTLSVLKKIYWDIPDSKHYRIYELVEMTCNSLEASRRRDFVGDINSVLEENISVYRFSKGRLERTMSDLEHSSVKKASRISTKSKEHVEKAIRHMNPAKPDYEASISESIKMVEHTAQALGGKGGGLNSLVGNISERLGLHPAMQEQFSQMYKFANKTSRHSEAGEEYDPDSNDAKAMLVWCSAMANYLADKAAAASTSATRRAPGGGRAGSPGQHARAQGRRVRTRKAGPEDR